MQSITRRNVVLSAAAAGAAFGLNRTVEIIPPAVNTDLGGAGLHTTGAPLEPFADEVVSRLAAGEEEIAYGTAQPRAAAAHAAFDEAFARMNG